jgi:AraC-like DNA-binding protein
MPQQFQTWAPAPALQPFIAFYWSSSTPPVNQRHHIRLMPDGLPGMVFQHKQGRSVYHNESGPLPTSFLYGQASRSCINQASETIDVLGVCLQPDAIPKLFGPAATAFSDRLISLQDLGFGWLDEKLMHATTLLQKLRILNESFLACRKWTTAKSCLVADSLQQIGNVRNQFRVDRLHQRYQISERQLLRLFTAAVGTSPYQYYQTKRFQQSLQWLQRGYAGNMAHLAFDLGYADQSHFNRVFKTFSGLTPKQFVKAKENALVDTSAQYHGQAAALPIRMIR